MADPFFTNPQMAAGVGHIVEALFGNPEKAGRFRVNQLQGDKLEQAVTGRQKLADYYARSQAGAPLSPEAIAAAVLGGIGGNEVSGYNLALNANNPGTPEEAIIGALVGTGKTLGPNDAVTLAGQTRIRRDDERVGDERNAATISGAYARQQLAGDQAMERQMVEPVQTGAGYTTTFAPGDPRGGTSGQVLGVPTETTARAAATSNILEGLLEPTDTNMRLAGASASPRGGSVPQVGFNQVDDIRSLVQQAFTDSAGEAPTVDQGLETAVINRASQIFQQTKNGPLAVQQAVQELTQATPADPGIPLVPFTGSPGRIAPRTEAPAAPPTRPVAVNSKEEMDALPPGARFLAPDGSVRVKQ